MSFRGLVMVQAPVGAELQQCATSHASEDQPPCVVEAGGRAGSRRARAAHLRKGGAPLSPLSDRFSAYWLMCR